MSLPMVFNYNTTKDQKWHINYQTREKPEKKETVSDVKRSHGKRKEIYRHAAEQNLLRIG